MTVGLFFPISQGVLRESDIPQCISVRELEIEDWAYVIRQTYMLLLSVTA